MSTMMNSALQSAGRVSEQIPKIRRVTESDIPWLHDLCARAFGAVSFDYDADEAEAWVRGMMNSPDHLLQRGDRSWMAVQVYSLPFNKRVKLCGLLPTASLGGARDELIQMAENAKVWAKTKGAKQFFISASPTGADLGGIALAIGGRVASPAYIVEL